MLCGFFHVFYVGPYFGMRRKSILEDALARRPKYSSLLRLLSKQGNTLLLYIYRVSRAEWWIWSIFLRVPFLSPGIQYKIPCRKRSSYIHCWPDVEIFWHYFFHLIRADRDALFSQIHTYTSACYLSKRQRPKRRLKGGLSRSRWFWMKIDSKFMNGTRALTFRDPEIPNLFVHSIFDQINSHYNGLWKNLQLAPF